MPVDVNPRWEGVSANQYPPGLELWASHPQSGERNVGCLSLASVVRNGKDAKVLDLVERRVAHVDLRALARLESAFRIGIDDGVEGRAEGAGASIERT